MNTFEKLAIAESAEQLFADVYGLLTRKYAEEPEYLALFTRLEQEEIQHAMRLKMLRKHYATPFVRELELNITHLLICIENGEFIKQQLESGELFASVAEAVAAMAELERQFAGAHAEMVIAVADSNLRKFFENLAKQDHGHASLLR